MSRHPARAAAVRACLVLSIATVASACSTTAPVSTRVPSSGNPPTTTPTAAPPATPAPTPREPAIAAPEATYGDWLAEVPAIQEIDMPAGILQLSVDFERGHRVWLQTKPDYRQLLASTSLKAAAGEIRLRSDAVDNVYCPTDTEGRYRWERSSDGLFLTLELVEDSCAARSAVFARTWVRSHSAVNDGGPGVISTTPMILSDLPARRWGMGEATLRTYDDRPEQVIFFQENPQGFREPCATPPGSPIDIEPTIPALLDHLRGLPGLTVKPSATQIDGMEGAHIIITSDAAADCASGGITALRAHGAADDSGDIDLVPGEALSLWAVDAGDELFVFHYAAEGFTHADEEAWISTITFIDSLPKP